MATFPWYIIIPASDEAYYRRALNDTGSHGQVVNTVDPQVILDQEIDFVDSDPAVYYRRYLNDNLRYNIQEYSEDFTTYDYGPLNGTHSWLTYKTASQEAMLIGDFEQRFGPQVKGLLLGTSFFFPEAFATTEIALYSKFFPEWPLAPYASGLVHEVRASITAASGNFYSGPALQCSSTECLIAAQFLDFHNQYFIASLVNGVFTILATSPIEDIAYPYLVLKHDYDAGTYTMLGAINSTEEGTQLAQVTAPVNVSLGKPGLAVHRPTADLIDPVYCDRFITRITRAA